MAYFWVHSFASLLYLQREEKRAKSVDDNCMSPDVDSAIRRQQGHVS